MMTYRKLQAASALAFLFLTLPVSAQWKSESFSVKRGWTAIFPLVDASDVTLDELLASHPDIEEVWRWNPEGLEPIVLDEGPTTGPEWSVWKRDLPEESTMTRLIANRGYLINAASDLTFAIVGKAVMPEVNWRTSGLNLVGFPAVEGTPPSIGDYLAPSGTPTSVSQYVGGKIGNNNPTDVSAAVTDMVRGEAYWVDLTGRYSDYYGPIKVQVSLSSTGLHFGQQGTTLQLILTNRSDEPVTVTLTPEASSADPDGSTPTEVPLLERLLDPGDPELHVSGL